jgi:hypothetical protein
VGGAAPQPQGLSPRNLWGLRTFVAKFVAVALFLAGTLCPSWFAVFEVHQNAGYVLTTRVLPRLVWRSLAPAQSPLRRASMTGRRLKPWWNSHSRDIRRTSIPRACKLPYCCYLTRVSRRVGLMSEPALAWRPSQLEVIISARILTHQSWWIEIYCKLKGKTPLLTI